MPVEPANTAESPVMLQVGNGLTVKTTSLVFMHPLASVTVRRSVAVADAPLTCTVVFKFVQLVQEVGESMVAPAVEETRVHPIELMAVLPGCATPLSEKAVEAPSVHLD